MHKGLSKILVAALIAVSIVVIGIAAYLVFGLPASDKEGAKKSEDSSTQQTADTKTSDVVPNLIYSETISEVNNADRSWPTVNIYRTSDSNEKELLATVGKVGEYPSRFFLTPDHGKLLIGLESKLQILDLASKSLEDLLIPRYEIGDLVFSADGKEAYIWDQKYASDDKNFALHKFNLVSKSDTIVKSGVMSDKPQYLSPYALRPDGKIAMMEPMGEAYDLWYFDLESLAIVQSNVNGGGGGFLSGNKGKLIAIASTSIPDICNEMSGSSNSGYDIVDNVSGAKTTSVSTGNNIMTPVMFSPGDKQFLYYSTPPVTDAAACKAVQAESYFTFDLESSQSQAVTDYPALLKEWRGNSIGANYSSSDDGKTSKIVIGDKIIASSNKSLQIIAQYWK